MWPAAYLAQSLVGGAPEYSRADSSASKSVPPNRRFLFHRTLTLWTRSGAVPQRGQCAAEAADASRVTAAQGVRARSPRRRPGQPWSGSSRADMARSSQR
jgi:hypothetical protein